MSVVLWMHGTLVSFCLMAIGARELSGEVTVYQMLFFRSVIGLLCISAILFFTNKSASIQTERLALHSFRNIFHFAGQFGWFLGIGLLPLAEVFALEFTVPIWTLLVAAIVLNEKITARKLAAVFLGITGVLVIVRPGYAMIDPASFIVLGAAICYAIAHTSTKSLSTSESALSILFYMCLIQLPIGFVLSLPSWSWPIGNQWLWLSVVGLTALTAHYCMAKAMLFAEVTTVVTIDFLRLPLIALVGVLLYQEQFEMSLMIGGFLMLMGNFLSLKQAARYSA
ncbi:MAG: DMT family transporter [Sedimenticola sp.]|nr:DMT family transporter [Sedimenticola sp.]